MRLQLAPVADSGKCSVTCKGRRVNALLKNYRFAHGNQVVCTGAARWCHQYRWAIPYSASAGGIIISALTAAFIKGWVP
ncbi:MAG: hypothetical protein IPN43_15855 [Chitinophagaceae bacterium]|nr:hypothetical protein [Chitinophagaceae bacterium]